MPVPISALESWRHNFESVQNQLAMPLNHQNLNPLYFLNTLHFHTKSHFQNFQAAAPTSMPEYQGIYSTPMYPLPGKLVNIQPFPQVVQTLTRGLQTPTLRETWRNIPAGEGV